MRETCAFSAGVQYAVDVVDRRLAAARARRERGS